MALPKQEGKKTDLFCDNAIAEIGEEKKICGNCGNAIGANGRGEKQQLPKFGEELKKNVTSTIFSQQITGDQLLLV